MIGCDIAKIIVCNWKYNMRMKYLILLLLSGFFDELQNMNFPFSKSLSSKNFLYHVNLIYNLPGINNRLFNCI